MRQRLAIRKVRHLRQQTGLDIIAVLVRGGTDHRKDLCLRDGTVACLWPDGAIEQTATRHGVDVPHELRHPGLDEFQ